MNKTFRRLIDQGVAKCLRARGFERKGTQFWRDLDTGVVHVVDVFRPSWNQPANGTDFHIECGVCIAAYLEIFPDHRGIKSAREAPRQVRVRLPELVQERILDPLFLPGSISEEDFLRFVSRLATIFERNVIPWFARFGTPSAVGDFLSSTENAPGHYVIRYRNIVQHPDDLRKAAIAYFAAAEYERARHMLDLADTTIDRSGRHATTELRERIERLIAVSPKRPQQNH
jgi:uncharacterized protein DUF4304